MNAKMRSFVDGILLSLPGIPMPFAVSKEPVAYLYNGVQLPGLPEWDKDEYPYAVISYDDDNTYPYGFTAHNFESYVGVTDSGTTMLKTRSSGRAITYRFIGGTWGYYAEFGGSPNSAYKGNVMYASRIIWSNYDILNEDGSLYFAGSTPIPVYDNTDGLSVSGAVIPYGR